MKIIHRKIWRCTCLWLKAHYLYNGFSTMRELSWILDRMKTKKNSPSARIIIRTIEEKLK